MNKKGNMGMSTQLLWWAVPLSLLLGALSGGGVWMAPTWFVTVYIVAGALIGSFNIDMKEAALAMLAGIVIAGGAGTLVQLTVVGGAIGGAVESLAFVAGGLAVVTAIKALWNISS